MAGRAPDQDVAAAEVEGDLLLREIGHAPEADHLVVGQAHVAGVRTVGELVHRGIVIGVQVAEGDQQFEAGGIAAVAAAPLVDALVDHAAQVPVVAQLHEPFVEQQHAVVAEIERRERRLVAVGLVLPQDRRVRVVPVDLHRWVCVVHA